MPRNFTYVLNQLRMDTMAQCTSPTLSNSMTNPVLGQHLLINTIAFPSLRSATDDWKQFMNKSSGDGIPSNTPNSVKKGYEFQKKILQDQILSNDAGTFETMAIS
ncbi:hypothetical protein HZS61_017268 [Fusarium oxysporum f. sp. conglutinans]|uniref:Uncharacterized protein n=1 Tax=Fusarium oxysporum f. sp. conglutinans TaxID=100902 RepID=A0A8H6GIA3_FUSOX|nr:hypothetical protein HZS61_017268 [Fusarium oxysporum f. sp. conglutinans]